MFDWGKNCTFAAWKGQETPFPNPLTFPTAVDLFDIPREGAREPEVEKSPYARVLGVGGIGW